MSWVMVGVAAVGTVSSAVAENKASKDKKKAAREIAAQKEVPLDNAAEGLQVSTRGADLQREEAARLASTQVDALSEGGTRAIVGGIGRVSDNNAAINANIGADLDRQQKEIDQIGAQDKVNIRQTKEQRLQNKIAALSSQYNAANQSQSMNTANVIQGLGSVASAGNAGNWGKKKT